MAITVAMQQTVAAMYAALFNRAPEKAGLDFWCGQLDSGVSLAAMAQTMYETAPARATYPDGISNADVVKAFYLNVLGRAGDAEGLAFWEARLNTLGTKGALIAEMVANVQSYTGTDPAGVTSKALFDNKVTVGFAYAVTLGKEDVELAKSVLALVTATDTSAALSAANVGQTFTLTTSADTLVGTSGNDTFTGAFTGLQGSDTIIDQSSTDADVANLTLTSAISAGNANKAKIAGVEKVNLEWNAFGTASVDAENISGATITLTSAKAGFLGNGTVTNAAKNTVTAGSGMVGTLTVAGITEATVNGGVAKSLVVDGTTTNTKNLSVTVNAGTATTSVDVGSTNGFVAATIDAGAAKTIKVTDADAVATTDGYTATVKSSAATVSLTNEFDVLNYEATVNQTLTLVDNIEKSMTITGAGKVAVETVLANVSGLTLTGADSLKITDAAATGDLTKIDAKTVELAVNAGGTVTFVNGQKVLLSSDQSSTLTVKNGAVGTADSLSLSVTKAQTSLTTSDVETTNVAVDVAATTVVGGYDINLATFNAGTKKVVLTGNNSVEFGTALTAKTLDASGLTGNLKVVSTSTAAMDIIGSVGKNNIDTGVTAAGATASVTTGDADDTVKFDGTAGDAVANVGGGKNSVTSAVVGGTLVVNSGAGDDTVLATALSAGTLVASLGDGKNTISTTLANGATDNVTIATGAGADSIKLGLGTNDATDVLTITAGDGTDTLTLDTTGALKLGTISLSGIEAIQIGAASAAGTSATFAAKILSGQSYAIAGGSSTTVTVDATATTAGETIDLSSLVIDQSLTKAVTSVVINGTALANSGDTITGTAIADTIDGKAGKDTITGGKGADALTGGADADTFVFAAGDSGTTTATADTIADFVSGTDKIKIGLAGTVANYTEVDGAAVATLAAAVTAADAAFAGSATNLQFYAVFDLNGTGAGALLVDLNDDNATDLVIQLTGVGTAAGFNYADIIA
ncbi:DUF4214 domain-containing protein [Herbaspirillum sp. GCM10030257]|uniref:DUF4214 domain-containing protein n=1 Tax=Herbaspirillum sp. GCM10030257 TaxID=3273393 RepID=UPI0036240A01